MRVEKRGDRRGEERGERGEERGREGGGRSGEERRKCLGLHHTEFISSYEQSICLRMCGFPPFSVCSELVHILVFHGRGSGGRSNVLVL